ncbi:hypothetical protein FA95DRAFT_1375800 [Auriscalpium vulgare]|uniref:Uncharacterized protein n=1 Tax=Auriscalpium vulgare TaxID=40419 RepID=A0ACB8S6N6_9AGAM|nr:hypothetical protein FA95DRAFT_1375800 [Auriscalpium vulgare]
MLSAMSSKGLLHAEVNERRARRVASRRAAPILFKLLIVPHTRHGAPWLDDHPSTEPTIIPPSFFLLGALEMSTASPSLSTHPDESPENGSQSQAEILLIIFIHGYVLACSAECLIPRTAQLQGH